MAVARTLESLSAMPAKKIATLYKNARVILANAKSTDSQKAEAQFIVDTVREHGLLKEAEGGLKWDNPIMEDIADLCLSAEALGLAVAVCEQGQPALSGMEHLLVAALGENYGGQYTTHHAGRKLAEGLEGKGWISSGKQKPMPDGSVAKTATVFVRRK